MLYVKKLLQLFQQTVPETDPRRIAATVQMAEARQTCGDYGSAEVLLVELWKQLTDATREHSNAVNEELRLHVVRAYITFLQRCKRDAEATSLLLGLRAEAERLNGLIGTDHHPLWQLQKIVGSGLLPPVIQRISS